MTVIWATLDACASMSEPLTTDKVARVARLLQRIHAVAPQAFLSAWTALSRVEQDDVNRWCKQERGKSIEARLDTAAPGVFRGV